MNHTAHALAALCLLVAPVRGQAAQYTITNVAGSQPGNMAFPGYQPTTMLVFNTADCRTGCGSRTWFELHAIVWNHERNEVGFQIFYLDPLIPGVFTGNTLVLPGVTSLDTAFPDATWRLDN